MASFLESMGKMLSIAHKGSIVGIDIGSSSIKVVEIEKVDEKVVLRNYGELSLGPRAGSAIGQATNLPTEKLAEALRDLLSGTGISVKHTVFAIPFSASLLSVVDLPDLSTKELQSMVPLEARRYIPVPITEVALDWWVLPKRKVEQNVVMPSFGKSKVIGKVEVIIAAIHNEIIKKYQEIKHAAQIPGDAVHFEIEIFSTMRAIVGRDLSSIIVIDIGAGSTKLVLVDEGVVRGSHIINIGGQDITSALSKSLGITFAQAEEMKCRAGIIGDEDGRDVAVAGGVILSNIMNESARFMENYEQKHNTKIKKIILTGGGASLKGIEKVASQKFTETSVSVGDTFSRIDTPAFLAPTIKELSPYFAVAVGLALKGLEE